MAVGHQQKSRSGLDYLSSSRALTRAFKCLTGLLRQVPRFISQESNVMFEDHPPTHGVARTGRGRDVREASS